MSDKIILFLVTGVAGAGKTTFASVCEEKGYHVIEDFPTSMIPSLLDVFKREPEVYDKVALFVNISKIEESAEAIKKDPTFLVTTVGLDCSSDVLITRFRLTRHIHPLQPKGYSLSEALAADAEKMEETHPLYDIYIDTTGLTEKDLRKKAAALLDRTSSKLHIIISSFGYKYGLPKDAEIVIDARGLINPYWVKTLSRMTGLDQPVIDYIESDQHTTNFMGKLFDLLDDYLARAVEEGRSFVVLDVGCSGGQHRSVYVAEKIFAHYKNVYACTLYHRELSRYLEDEKD
jgi:UPF0042 nucleotide-binding protein